ncbi:hypothetical protein TNCT_419051 [Trichonephila clavata]|uniref:Uncharacterized protein n=1 Tax=Trichonephila clavata TaxID=2740835 RepID=A0A8X6FD27_TRICU|nr:hypothetical protein TNCT_419051 [Trichonephila clavata]
MQNRKRENWFQLNKENGTNVKKGFPSIFFGVILIQTPTLSCIGTVLSSPTEKLATLSSPICEWPLALLCTDQKRRRNQLNWPWFLFLTLRRKREVISASAGTSVVPAGSLQEY